MCRSAADAFTSLNYTDCPGYNALMQLHLHRTAWSSRHGMVCALLALLAGCSTSTVVPASLKGQVDEHIMFSQIKASSDSYQGRIVVLGGEVLSAKRLKDGTRIEVLQLPLYDQEPGLDRTKSEGRFIAIQKEFLDPATLPKGTRVTVVGEVTGSTTLPLDDTEYVYPTVEIKNLTVWPDRSMQRALPPYYYGGPYGPYGPYWGPYWGRGYWYGPYWW